MSEHYQRRGDDELEVVFWLIFVLFSPVIMAMLIFFIAPHLKAGFFSALLKAKALEAKIVHVDDEYRTLNVEAKKYKIYSRSIDVARKRASTSHFWNVFRNYSKRTNFRIGIVISVLFFILAGLSYWYFNRNENRDSPQKLKEKFYKKTLKDICKEFDLPYPLPKDPVKLAELFTEERRTRNIPPNLLARKISDPVLSMAVSWFNRVVPPKELDMEPTIMVPIRDPRKFEEYLNRMMKELNDEEKEKKRVEELQSLIEQIMQQQQQQRRGGFGGGFGRF